MLYLKPGENVTAQAIACSFDKRATAESGYLDGTLVFRVEVEGILVGYVVPPAASNKVWGINLVQGAHEVRGYFNEVIRHLETSGLLINDEGISVQAMVEDNLSFDLEFFAPI
jgi:hypothetical protein